MSRFHKPTWITRLTTLPADAVTRPIAGPVARPVARAVGITAMAITLGVLPLSALAQETSEDEIAALPEENPTLTALTTLLLDVQQLPLGFTPGQGTSVITHETLSDRNFTEPSLWWQQDQISPRLGGERLVVGWSAYPAVPNLPEQALMDVSVNGQIWSLLNYLEQYALVNQFGQTAQSYGYQLRFFVNGSLIGAYLCDFAPASAISVNASDIGTSSGNETEIATSMAPCLVSLDYRGRGGIRGRTTSIFR
jgi:hypothetical protein